MLDLMKTFDFEDQPVRVIQRDGEPWFVAADVCRVLAIANARDAVSRLDEDERETVNLNTVGISDGIPGNPNVNIISESGLYALVFTSTKAEAKRFRKWVTGTVLPALRKTGTYTDPLHLNPAPERPPIDFMARQDVSNWLSMVREARLLRGPVVAERLWRKSPLPELDDPQEIELAAQSDPFIAFFRAQCRVTGNRHDKIRSRDLVAAFHAWAEPEGWPPLTERTVAVRFSAMARTWRCPETMQRFTAHKANLFNGYMGVKFV